MDHRLAVVMATDMVGYSRLMEIDELGVLARQKKYRREVIDPEITRSRGQVLPSCRQQIVLPCERRGSRSHLSGVIGPEAERIVAGVAV